MIAANVTVANFLKWQEIPAIYRIHEEPTAKAHQELCQYE
jgi:ribonuclease R